MPDNDNKNPYDVLLEQMDTLKEELSTVRKELDDMKQFNRALLNRNNKGKTPNSEDVDDKFRKYLEGE